MNHCSYISTRFVVSKFKTHQELHYKKSNQSSLGFYQQLKMAKSSPLSSSSFHSPVRSVSLPSRLTHLDSFSVDAELVKLQDLKSSSAESFQLGLKRVAELFNNINQQVLCSSHTQQVLRRDNHAELVEDALDASIILLDACDFTRELVASMKDQTRELQSVLRRKSKVYTSIKKSVSSYIRFRKISRRDVSKRVRSLTRTRTDISNKLSFHKCSVVDQSSSMAANMLTQSSIQAISMFESLLLFLSTQTDKSKGCKGWSLITRLIPNGTKLRHQLCLEVNNSKIDVQATLKRLNTLNVELESIQEELEFLSRRLIQHRGSLLDLLTP